MYKIVLQIPLEDARADLPDTIWQEGPSPHGPHIKTQAGKDAETGHDVVFVRCKHRSLNEVLSLSNEAVRAVLGD